ncbi:MAG: hypothetical protein Tsb0010_19980 [Parvularculaceae bacterium]
MTARVLFIAAMLAIAPASAQSPAVEVMILGVYHMGNPGQDIANVDAEDVTTPQRQSELEALAARLAEFQPTKIMIESVPTRDDFIDDSYRNFTPADLLSNRDERVQIGYRLAHRLGHEHVYAVDEQNEDVDYFPFGAVQQFAASRGQTPALERLIGEIQTEVADFGALQETASIRELLAYQNDNERTNDGHEKYYYGLLELSGFDEQPGADLNAYWYMRNAKIFAKLMQAADPGDRVLLIFGAGHNYWLRHFAQTTPGYELVDVNDYLIDK